MTTVEALWVVGFGTGEDPHALVSGGVLILETGRIFGGDSAYAYLGGYQVEKGSLSGQLRIIRHNSDLSFTDIWETGDTEVRATFSGTMVSSDSIQGVLNHETGAFAAFRMTRLAELP